MSLVGLLQKFVRCTSGTAVLEAAIVVPVAIVLMAGGVEFGRLFAQYETASKSMRDAARYLARVPNTDTSGNPTTDYICGWGLTNAQNLAVYGKISPANTDQSLIANWTTAEVTLQSPSCGGTPSPPIVIELRSAVPYTGLMFTAIGIGNAWTIHLKHQERSIGE